MSSEELYAKYKEFLKNAEIAQSRTLKFCPYPNCENTVVEVQDPSTREVTCMKCNRNFCF